MATEFSNILLKSEMREATSNSAAQCDSGRAFGLHGIAKNIANFFLHAVAMATCPPPEPSFDSFFKISDDQLRHKEPHKMIS